MDDNSQDEQSQSQPDQRDYRKQREEYLKQQQQEAQIRSLLKQILDSAAYARLSNIRLSNPELYQKVAQLLISLYQSGRLKNRIDETTFKALMSRLLSQKREGKITIERK
ncbi:MAG: DNA-binding protein [Candidatus Micrarchaeota archaeon]